MAKSAAGDAEKQSLAPRHHEEASSPVRGREAEAAISALDRVIHERIRLAIVPALSVNESLSCNELKQLLGTSDGNLSVHARRLEDAGYLACSKSFEGRLPRTDYRLTPAGVRAFSRYPG